MRSDDLASEVPGSRGSIVWSGLLGAVSILAAVLVVTTYLGLVRVPRSAAPDVAPLNLNGTVSAERLESILERVFPLPADRRVAGQQLLSFIETAEGGRRSLPNVGAIARVRVPVAAIDAFPQRRRFGSGSSRSASARDRLGRTLCVGSAAHERAIERGQTILCRS